MSKKPKVSVVTISYNHEKYIREALESFVTQKTNFDFEVIIADDCSTDNTQAIIREYARLYPDIIKPILRKKNVGAQQNSVSSLQAATGDYIALCEGDDFWTDPQKLQLQADFMDAHPDYGLCFHPVRVFFEGDVQKEFVAPEVDTKEKFTAKGLLARNFIYTNSVMYRRQSYDDIPDNIMPLDWYLHLRHARFGKIGFIRRVMSAYRRHPGGIWWDSYENMDEIWKKYGLSHLAVAAELLRLYGDDKERKAIIVKLIRDVYGALVRVDEKYHEQFVRKAVVQSPELAEILITTLYDELAQHGANSQIKEQELNALREKEAATLAQVQRQLDDMHASRIWKVRNKLAKLIGK